MRAIVPGIWPLEVGNVLLVAERRGRLSHVDGMRFWELLSELPIDIEQQLTEKMIMEPAMNREIKLDGYEETIESEILHFVSLSASERAKIEEFIDKENEKRVLAYG